MKHQLADYDTPIPQPKPNAYTKTQQLSQAYWLLLKQGGSAVTIKKEKTNLECLNDCIHVEDGVCTTVLDQWNRLASNVHAG